MGETDREGNWVFFLMGRAIFSKSLIQFPVDGLGSKLQIVTAAMKLKDACSLEEKL